MSAQGNNDDSPDTSQRRERAAIAAQACQTCRNRKSKCDEQRPKCGLCRRLNVECQYREPQPTKKDKTMVHILESLQRLEAKFDSHLTLSNPATVPSIPPSPVSSRDNAIAINNGTPAFMSDQISNAQEDKPRGLESRLTQENAFPKELQRSYRHLTVAHKIILWPAVYLHIVNTSLEAAHDLQFVLQDGTPWFIHLELEKHPLPLRCNSVPTSLVATSPHMGDMRSGFLGLTPERIAQLTDAYFSTFNIIHPILDKGPFVSDIIAPMMQDGFFESDITACLALLVLALGQVAMDGVHGTPVSNLHGTPSGLRGGTVEDPPGLEIFNEARKRIGFVMNQCSLENVQVFLLQATYFESCARHMDFWRSTTAASMSCQVLIRCERIDWSTHRADLIKRAYWTCILSEDLYHLELDLPQTGIHTLEDKVPLPYFHEARNSQLSMSDEKSHFQYHFLAMIALRRLITRIHGSIHGSSKSAESAEDYGGPPVHVIKELARRLESWRSLLPQPLQWSDVDKFDFPNTNPLGRRPNDTLFALDQGPVPIRHRYNLDIVTGQLRTRFYYARFMIYRPFVYKALHFPELMTPQDCDCCALAIQSACLWPLAMAPCKNKKRLVPHLFTWTQNFLGILLILRMTAENICLKAICDERVDKHDMENTAALLLDWMRDMKQVDGIAEWSWRILEPLYTSP